VRRGPSLLGQFFAIVLLGGVAFGVCLVALIPATRDLAGANATQGSVSDALSPLSQRTVVYASDGTSQIGVLGLEDRQYAQFSDVPDDVINAVVATEDQTFWHNPGIDFRSVARALSNNLTEGQVAEGGSTITMQLAKNRLLTPKRDLNRKARELVLAFRLNSEFTKQEILEQYLNTVYFGQGSYGIESAAQRFFVTTDPATGQQRGKHLDELNLAEAALLAGSIQNPEGDNPFRNPARAAARRGEVLANMREQGFITKDEEALGDLFLLPTVLPPAELRPDNYFVEEVQRRLLNDDRLGVTPEERRNAVLRGGLKVVSTMDLLAQFNAQAAVNEVLPDAPPFTGALVALDPQNGFVKAVVGGPGFEKSQYNLATQPPGRQPGSTYKMITLAAALEAGYSPNDTINGSDGCIIRGYGENGKEGVAHNAESGGGTRSLRSATAGSVNCAFLRLVEVLGVDKVVDMAHRMGIEDIEGLRKIADDKYHTSVTLGTDEATPLEMATVGAVLANEGVRHEPVFVEKVIASDGTVLIDNSTPEGERVIEPEIADCEVNMLQGVVTGGTGTAARLGTRQIAGKTGTTDKKADAWFVGFTPTLVAAVWRGAPNALVPGAGFGGEYPARTWHAFMEAQLAGQPELEFPDAGPVCERPGKYIKEKSGRQQYQSSATNTTVAPDTVPPDTVPPATTRPPSTTRKPLPPTTVPPPPPS
jgi:membrane peptidoglycan carboxypeptidase